MVYKLYELTYEEVEKLEKLLAKKIMVSLRYNSKIIFDALGLTQEEREEVYYEVCELVQNRLNKARSV